MTINELHFKEEVWYVAYVAHVADFEYPYVEASPIRVPTARLAAQTLP